MTEGNFQAPDTTLSPPVGLRKIRIQFLQPYYSSLPSVVPWKPLLESWSILETSAYLFKPRMSYTILDLPPSSLLQAESIENLKKKKKIKPIPILFPISQVNNISTWKTCSQTSFTKGYLGLPWCQRRRHEFDSWSGKIPHAMKQLSLCTTITEAVL